METEIGKIVDKLQNQSDSAFNVNDGEISQLLPLATVEDATNLERILEEPRSKDAMVK